jgi:hypothetical protein
MRHQYQEACLIFSQCMTESRHGERQRRRGQQRWESGSRNTWELLIWNRCRFMFALFAWIAELIINTDWTTSSHTSSTLWPLCCWLLVVVCTVFAVGRRRGSRRQNISFSGVVSLTRSTLDQARILRRRQNKNNNIWLAGASKSSFYQGLLGY